VCHGPGAGVDQRPPGTDSPRNALGPSPALTNSAPMC
jgi:hypothetical protein